MTDPAICRFLSWDTEFFGFRIGQATVGRLGAAEEMASILEWVDAENIRCLYFLAESDSPETVRSLELNGFELSDIRLEMTYRCSADDAAEEDVSYIRSAREADVPALCAIARKSYGDSRFYNDPRFPRERCAALYETWVQRSCLEGFADVVLVAEFEGRPVGYSTYSVRDTGEGQIELLAVDSIAKGRGVGNALIRAALVQLARRGVPTVKTATQGRNIPALRTLQGAGFRIVLAQLWYHRWFDAPSA
jgi:ribosomal protein S18 acetylase RimI-like enzyme